MCQFRSVHHDKRAHAHTDTHSAGHVAHRLALPQLLLGAVEVKVHVQTLHELCDWVLVGVRLLGRSERKGGGGGYH